MIAFRKLSGPGRRFTRRGIALTPDEYQNLLSSWFATNVVLGIPVLAVNVLAIAVWFNGDTTWTMNAIQAAVTLPWWASLALYHRTEKKSR